MALFPSITGWHVAVDGPGEPDADTLAGMAEYLHPFYGAFSSGDGRLGAHFCVGARTPAGAARQALRIMRRWVPQPDEITVVTHERLIARNEE